MKIFALYTKLDLATSPPWLNEFRKKYDEPWDLHITLKQPCFVPDGGIEELRSKVDKFFAELEIPDHAIPVRFEEVVSSREVILVRAQQSDVLMGLQRDLVSTLRDFKDYVDPESQAWEENFDPHLTIGRDLSPERYRKALEYLTNGCRCEGVISEVVLAIVKDDTIEEGLDPANQTIYDL